MRIDYVAQYALVPTAGATPVFNRGVELPDWAIVYDDPVEFRGILDVSCRPLSLRFLVLKRPPPL